MTPGWVEDFVRSTWCLSTFELPEVTIVVMIANPRLGAHSRGHYTETLHASIVRNVGTLADVNRVDLRLGLLILSVCCVMIANPRLGAHSRGHYTETLHASIARNVR